MPSEATLEEALAVMTAAPGPVSRSDLLGVAPRSYERKLHERATAAGLDPRRLAASRLVWRLARRGDVCVADKVGAEQTYATRSAWFGTLPWVSMPAPRAAAALTRRYFAVYGPAMATDVAHFFGARVTNARRWLATLEAELAPVRCGDRTGLVALTDDVRALDVTPPRAASAWPVRLLPSWESMLMGHADKSWTVPDTAERPLVWRKAAFVAAVVLARGRVVATWSHVARRRRLRVNVQPLSAWRARAHAAGVRREAQAVAAHLELDAVEVTIG